MRKATILALTLFALPSLASAETGEKVAEAKVHVSAASVAKLQRSARLGFGPAQYRLGLLYASGDGVRQNLRKAVHWWLLSAKNLDAQAQLELGTAYAHGWGVPKNPGRAIYWWKRAARDGNRVVAHQAQRLLDSAV